MAPLSGARKSDMKRTWWMTQAGCGIVVVVAVAMLAGPAWADPTGDSECLLGVNGNTFAGPTGAVQRIFLTTDPTV